MTRVAIVATEPALRDALVVVADLGSVELAGPVPAPEGPALEALRRLCRWAHGEGKLAVNPAAEVKLARTMRDLRPAGLNETEVTALLRAAGQCPVTG